MRMVAVSLIINRFDPTKFSSNTFTFAESVSFTQSNGGVQVKSSSHFFTRVKFLMGILAKKVIVSMGKLPFSHCTLKETVSPSSTVSVGLTDGFTREGMISV